jgi:uncharacterized protein (TIGR02246 family)
MAVDVHADIQAIEEIRRRVEAAENAGDPEYYAGLLADDAVFMVPDFPVQNGRDACAAFLRDLMPGLIEVFDRRITYAGSEVRVLDDIAFDRGEFAFTIRPRSGGDASRVTGKYFWLYARAADGGWRLSRAVVTRDDPDERSGSQLSFRGSGPLANGSFPQPHHGSDSADPAARWILRLPEHPRCDRHQRVRDRTQAVFR